MIWAIHLSGQYENQCHDLRHRCTGWRDESLATIWHHRFPLDWVRSYAAVVSAVLGKAGAWLGFRMSSPQESWPWQWKNHETSTMYSSCSFIFPTSFFCLHLQWGCSHCHMFDYQRSDLMEPVSSKDLRCQCPAQSYLIFILLLIVVKPPALHGYWRFKYVMLRHSQMFN